MAYLGQNEDLFNPPAYYQSTAPNQVPVQLYPYGGSGGLWPGFYIGQRTISQEDADRIARERQRAMELRAETSDDPEDKYLSPEGRLNPTAHGLIVAARHQHQQQQVQRASQGFQNKMLMTALIGAVIAALLK